MQRCVRSHLQHAAGTLRTMLTHVSCGSSLLYIQHELVLHVLVECHLVTLQPTAHITMLKHTTQQHLLG